MIPVYTTDSVPVRAAGPIEQAWPVWGEAKEIGEGVDLLAQIAEGDGAHAVIGLRIATFSAHETRGILGTNPRYAMVGTAVILGPRAPERGPPLPPEEPPWTPEDEGYPPYGP
ncbi:hypothetical protein ETD83_18050 [Actinomadura soli]|uniref:Uncharacterized protein n=1 Tax=Actinomadura soli TaxID=2508997 RepID=A0A5C4JBJ5_9ACTN|nr:hypothetical protein [Actinomadura soli]TMQ99256.1 hypothetical protein ETD83_18050 [Actinomadura soli]